MCAGVLRDLTTAVGQAVQRAGDFLVLVGEPRDQLGGSLYARLALDSGGSAPPELGLEREARLHELAVSAAEGRWVRAAHDVSDGGLAATFAEMLLAAADPLGAEVDLGVLETESTAALFSERSGIVFEVDPARATSLFQAARDRGLLAWPLGTVSARPRLSLLLPGGDRIGWEVEELRAAVRAPLPALWNEEDS